MQGGIRFAGRRMQGHGLSCTSSPGPRLLPEERVQECVQRCLRGPMPLRLPGGPLSLTHVKLYCSCPALASDCVSPPAHGVGSRPSARLKLAAPCSRPPTATSPAPPTTMKLTPPASLGRPPFHTKSISRCNFGYRLLGSRKRLCLPISLWGGLPAYCKREDRSPSLISFHSDQVSPTEEAKLW